MDDPKVYSGPGKVVIAFDIGTTFSGISYSILEPGKVPEIFGVNRFPAQKRVQRDAKVPSPLYYDKDGHFKAAGAEVLTEDMAQNALKEGWAKAEWWKLHLSPNHLDDLPPLPQGKSAVDVLTDFIKYLFQCARIHILEQHPEFTWPSSDDSIEYVFTYPNGWGSVPQYLYRRAIELAGLIPCTPEGLSRVHMLSEGEASLRFCVSNLLDAGTLAANRTASQGVVIIDAGGGTVDLSVYSMTTDPISCEEIVPPECRLQGSVFVTRRARALFERKLKGWDHASDEEIAEYTREFDQSTRLIIKSDNDPVYTRVSGRRYHNAQYGIKFGKLRLSGEEATGLFKDSIDAIIDAFEQQQKYAAIPITTAFLVGELSAVDWVWSQLHSYFEAKKIDLRRPDNHINKAVANGAVLSHIDHEDNYVRKDNHRKGPSLQPTKLQSVMSLEKERDLTAEIHQGEGGDSRKADQLAIAFKQVKKLQGDLSAVASKLADVEGRYETQSRVLVSTHKRLQKSESRTEEIRKHYEEQSLVLKSTIASLTTEVDQQKRAGAQKAEQLALAVKEVEGLQKYLDISSSKLADLETRFEAQSRELTSVRDQLQISESRTEEIHNSYDKQLQYLKSTVKERQPQLFEVQQFVTLADEYAEEMIVQMLHSINEDIERSTSLVAGYFVRHLQPVTKPAEEQKSADRTRKLIGQTLVYHLQNSKSRDDAVSYLTIALRAYLAYRIRWILSSWTLDKAQDAVNDALDRIYEPLQKSETPTVTGRWRSLTRAYISFPGISNPSDLVPTMVDGLADIVVAAGCTTSVSVVSSKLSTTFRHTIFPMISAAVQLRKIIGNVVTSDFEPVAIPHPQIFNATTMEVDTLSDGIGHARRTGKAMGQKILCVTSLGLMKRELLPESNQDTLISIKAKVVLEPFPNLCLSHSALSGDEHCRSSTVCVPADRDISGQDEVALSENTVRLSSAAVTPGETIAREADGGDGGDPSQSKSGEPVIPKSRSSASDVNDREGGWKSEMKREGTTALSPKAWKRTSQPRPQPTQSFPGGRSVEPTVQESQNIDNAPGTRTDLNCNTDGQYASPGVHVYSQSTMERGKLGMSAADDDHHMPEASTSRDIVNTGGCAEAVIQAAQQESVRFDTFKGPLKLRDTVKRVINHERHAYTQPPPTPGPPQTRFSGIRQRLRMGTAPFITPRSVFGATRNILPEEDPPPIPEKDPSVPSVRLWMGTPPPLASSSILDTARNTPPEEGPPPPMPEKEPTVLYQVYQRNLSLAPTSSSVFVVPVRSESTFSEEVGRFPAPDPCVLYSDKQWSSSQFQNPSFVSEEQSFLPPSDKGPSVPYRENQWNSSPLPIPGLDLDALGGQKGQSVPYQENQWNSMDTGDALGLQATGESEKIEQLQRELGELRRRFEAQSRDLEISNSFPDTADKSLDSDVIRALQRLNAELQQNTTYMADCLAEDLEFRNIAGSELASVAQRISKRIGHTLAVALGTGIPEEIPMLLSIAFQAYLASELCQIISSWTLRSQNNSFIADVYESVCRSEPQAVSGRWRVITRGHIIESYITHPESPVTHIIEDLSDILLVTGCTTPQSDIVSKITSKFKEKIVSLVDLAGRLKKAFDDVISSDFAVFIAQPGQEFTDDCMEDTDGGQIVTAGPVLCTTHLGLMKRVPVGTLWEHGQRQVTTVLKTKILLESFLDTEDE